MLVHGQKSGASAVVRLRGPGKWGAVAQYLLNPDKCTVEGGGGTGNL